MNHAAAEPGCAYCGLPLPAAWWPQARDAEQPHYCCYGCQFAAAVAGAGGDAGQARWLLTRLGIAVFFAMNVMAFTMALWTQDLYPADGVGRFSATLYGLFRHLCLLFTMPVLLLLGGPLAINAWEGLQRGRLSTDLLLLLGVAAAVAVSAVAVWRDEGSVYFEVACAVLVLVTLGRWLEAQGKQQAAEAVAALEKLLPDLVRLQDDAGERMVERRGVAVGARVRVLAGERIPCDGVVQQHPVLVDEQLLTGESQEQVKEPGDAVHAGSLNLDGPLLFEVSAGCDDDTMARLVKVMRDARQSQGRYERLAERLAHVLLPAVIIVALSAAGVHAWLHGLDRGILTGLAVVLIACPCALGIATPLAVWAALGQAALRGVLIRSGEGLERLATIRTVAFDKTGTLTTGTPRLDSFISDSTTSEADLLERAHELASASTHSLARALVEHAQRDSSRATWTNTGSVRNLPGRGIQATDAQTGAVALLGSMRLMREHHQAMDESIGEREEAALRAGQPMCAMAWDGRVRGLFVFEEVLRPDALAALRQLRSLGIDVQVLTGDHRARGRRLALELGVPVEAEQLPEDKVALIQQLRVRGPVAMVGDGMNDGPALAASDVGLAMGCGADIVRAAASVCILHDHLECVPWVIRLARRTTAIIRQNLFWAVAYNILGIGLACTGQLNPVWAAIAMTASGSLVLLNSARLTRSNEPAPNTSAGNAPSGEKACLKPS